jgi:hypothetical protein
MFFTSTLKEITALVIWLTQLHSNQTYNTSAICATPFFVRQIRKSKNTIQQTFLNPNPKPNPNPTSVIRARTSEKLLPFLTTGSWRTPLFCSNAGGRVDRGSAEVYQCWSRSSDWLGSSQRQKLTSLKLPTLATMCQPCQAMMRHLQLGCRILSTVSSRYEVHTQGNIDDPNMGKWLKRRPSSWMIMATVERLFP